MKWGGRLVCRISLSLLTLHRKSVCEREGEGVVSVRKRERVWRNNKQLFILTMSVRQDCVRFPPRGLRAGLIRESVTQRDGRLSSPRAALSDDGNL